ncbi:ADP-ribosyltransferase [Oscillospiraceae bacterium 42-9]
MEHALDGLISQYGNNHLNFIGQTFHDDGYVSTTALCGNPVTTRKPVLFEIDIPAGMGRGAYVNEFSEFTDAEYEFLLRRGADYTIVNVVLENDTGKIFIKMVMNDA